MSCCAKPDSNGCGPKKAAPEMAAPSDPSKMRDFVSDYYGKVLGASKDLKTNACTAAGRPPKWIIDLIRRVPQEINDKFYGCGTPIPGSLDGLTVVDLGSGSGRDCYIAAALTGPKGKVIGVDMTDEQLDVARAHSAKFCTETLGYPADVMEFKKGYIECLGDIGVAPGTVDLVISNCVVNLSPNKEAVIKGVSDLLKDGGELYFSDVYCDRRLPQEVVNHEVLFGECLSGALYIEDFKRLARKHGFTDPRVLSQGDITINNAELQEVCGEAKFYSITYRCFKLKSLETLCEDYGQVATYKGGIQGATHAYPLDDHHKFVKGKPMLVCGNTASMVSETRLAPYFTVQGDHSTHFGLFPCGPAPDAAAPCAPADCGEGGGCC